MTKWLLLAVNATSSFEHYGEKLYIFKLNSNLKTYFITLTK